MQAIAKHADLCRQQLTLQSIDGAWSLETNEHVTKNERYHYAEKREDLNVTGLIKQIRVSLTIKENQVNFNAMRACRDCRINCIFFF